MKSNQSYRVQLKGLASYDGTPNTTTVNKLFKSLNIKAIQQQQAAGLADLNGDGKVDFADFTIFSSVYGMVYGQAAGSSSGTSGSGATNATGNQPIAPAPDSTVPHTSTPAGGSVNSTVPTTPSNSMTSTPVPSTTQVVPSPIVPVTSAPPTSTTPVTP